MTKEQLIQRLEEAADDASECMRQCKLNQNERQAEYNLGRREALRWAAELIRKS